MKSSTVNAHIFVWMDNDKQNCNRYGDAIKLSNTIQSCVSVSMIVYAAVVISNFCCCLKLFEQYGKMPANAQKVNLFIS